MESTGTEFRQWLLAQTVCDRKPEALDDDHFRIRLDTAVAEVNIYPTLEETDEIAEYRIERLLDGETIFFLHVLLDNLTRAEKLFDEMASALETEAEHQPKHIMLCCTSALTTSMFAAKMGEVATALSLDYDFTALPVTEALRPGGDWSAVLLAPQVSHERSKMIEAHPEAAVFEIPGKIFGSYDAAGAIRLLMNALRDVQPLGNDGMLSAVRALDDDRQILIITFFVQRDSARLGYRLYDKGLVRMEGSVRKPTLDFRDVADLIEALSARSVDMNGLDAIGIAVPGITYRGSVTLPEFYDTPYDMGHALATRFGIPVYLDNNCNAAAVGCYMTQEDYESLIFFRHAFGHEYGGLGTVIDGKLLKGRGNLAGETKYFEDSINLGSPFREAIWTETGMQLLARGVILSAISLVSPEAVYLSVDTVDDADEFRDMLAEKLGDEYVPPVFIVTDYIERVYLGELAMCLQKLRDPRYRSLGVGAWKNVEPRSI